MARAILGPILTDLRGKIGNSVFDNYKGIHIVRSMPSVIVNPQSEHQTLARDALAAFVSAWKGLDIHQKQAWGQIACKLINGQESHGKRDRGCLIPVARGPFSAYNAFVSCNMNRYSSGFTELDEVLETAPSEIVLPEPLRSFSATLTDNGITAAWEYITPGPLFERLEIWIMSTGAKIHRQLVYTQARNADGSVEIVAARGRLGINLHLPNGVYSLQARIINQFGFTTAPSELAFVQIGGAEMFTYLETPVNALDVNNANANVDWTNVDLSGTIPEGAHSAILYITVKNIDYAGAVVANIGLRRDAAGGRIAATGPWPITPDNQLYGQTIIMPITTDRKIQYSILDSAGVWELDFDINIIGYIE